MVQVLKTWQQFRTVLILQQSIEYTTLYCTILYLSCTVLNYIVPFLFCTKLYLY